MFEELVELGPASRRSAHALVSEDSITASRCQGGTLQIRVTVTGLSGPGVTGWILTIVATLGGFVGVQEPSKALSRGVVVEDGARSVIECCGDDGQLFG